VEVGGGQDFGRSELPGQGQAFGPGELPAQEFPYELHDGRH